MAAYELTNEQANLVYHEPIEWACDCYRGYVGYSVHINNGVWPESVGFPAFTHTQMLKCAQINNALGEKYGFDSFAKLVYDEPRDEWREMYQDGNDWITEDIIRPFMLNGLKLYPLGDASGWVWGTISDDYEYECPEV